MSNTRELETHILLIYYLPRRPDDPAVRTAIDLVRWELELPGWDELDIAI